MQGQSENKQLLLLSEITANIVVDYPAACDDDVCPGGNSGQRSGNHDGCQDEAAYGAEQAVRHTRTFAEKANPRGRIPMNTPGRYGSLAAKGRGSFRKNC